MPDLRKAFVTDELPHGTDLGGIDAAIG